MHVYRVMSRDEYENLKRDVEWGLTHDAKGRKVRYKWFAMDLCYISTILRRGMYKNRRPRDDYTVLVEMEIYGKFNVKRELGCRNLGLDVMWPFEARIVAVKENITCADMKKHLHPLGYYWNREW